MFVYTLVSAICLLLALTGVVSGAVRLHFVKWLFWRVIAPIFLLYALASIALLAYALTASGIALALFALAELILSVFLFSIRTGTIMDTLPEVPLALLVPAMLLHDIDAVAFVIAGFFAVFTALVVASSMYVSKRGSPMIAAGSGLFALSMLLQTVGSIVYHALFLYGVVFLLVSLLFFLIPEVISIYAQKQE